MITTSPTCRPELDPDFIPAALWNRHYQELTSENPKKRKVRFALERPEGTRWVHDCEMLPAKVAYAEDNLKFAERLLKFLLWSWGASRVRIAGADEIAHALKAIYSPKGPRAFDYEFMGQTCFGEAFSIESATLDSLSEQRPASASGERVLTGNRIGFDLGGSDRKCAAIVGGEVVFSEEIKWSPYFESDPNYHRSGIIDSLKRAAAHMPHVDAIGGSAAGVYIDNEPRVGSLFRGISKQDFNDHIRKIFKGIKKDWGNVPFEVANDGDVTAIAGAMAINDNAVLGISMGTSLAAGYINPHGSIEGWINELAFVPVDYREGVAQDEWSGDYGCGVQYFSQQAVGRLIGLSGLSISDDAGLPEQLEAVQAKMAEGDQLAAAIYRSIGTYFGYTIAHFADFYDFRHLLFLGRVSSGEGGEIIMAEARKVLDLEFPELSAKVAFQTPDEKTKRHGQAIAAASLPNL